MAPVALNMPNYEIEVLDFQILGFNYPISRLPDFPISSGHTSPRVRERLKKE
jgi:hypothetical protein